MAPLVMLRRGRLKFVHTPVDPDQLYDLQADPLELRNLAADPAHAALVQAFRAEVAQRWSMPELTARVIAGQKRGRFHCAAQSQGTLQPWDHQPFQPASRPASVTCATTLTSTRWRPEPVFRSCAPPEALFHRRFQAHKSPLRWR